MIKTIVAHTAEIDDIEAAVGSILAQIDPENSLCANSVGIMSCNCDFVFSGAMSAISKALPFDVVGTVTSALAVNGECGTFLLSLMVLTSDDAEFVTRLTPSLVSDPCASIKKAYGEAAAEKPAAPALILTYAPFMVENAGDEYADAFTEVSGGVPCFGTLAIDDTDTFENSSLLFNGANYFDRMAMVLIYADINPRFLIATISPDKILPKGAVVTKSERHIIKELNGGPVDEYFESLGLLESSEMQYGMASLPFMLDYGDGTPPVSKVFIGRTPEKYAICAGIMPEGANLYIGVFDKADVLLTTGSALEKADIGGASCALMHSCISRNMSLGGDSTAEMELVRKLMGDKIPFVMSYSGGEMCPTQVSGSKAVNRFHNNTFIVCII